MNERFLYTYVDLFAGCGGLSLGIERSGGELRTAVEKSDMAARTFYFNFIDDSIDAGGWATHLRSSLLDQVRGRVAVAPLRDVLDLPEAISLISASPVDVVVGGPPCQGFSLAGRRNPEDVRNKLPWEFLEFVRRVKPLLVVIENVVGMNHAMAHGEAPPFAQLRQALIETEPGYNVQAVAVNAVHYGAPQNRPRLMLIGIRSDFANEINITTTKEIWRSTFVDEIRGEIPDLAPRPTVRKNESPTIADAIGDLQNPEPGSDAMRSAIFRKEVGLRSLWGLPAGTGSSGTPPNQERRSHTADTQQRFRVYQWLRANDISPRLISDFTKGGIDGERGALLSLGSVEFPAVAPDGTVLAESTAELIKLLRSLKTRKHSQKALSWESSAPTVVTLPDDYVHPSEPRTFTVRELARFQGFPDDFEFQGRVTTGAHRRRFEVPQYSQVGNAVSPFLGLAVGTMLARVLTMSAVITQSGRESRLLNV